MAPAAGLLLGKEPVRDSEHVECEQVQMDQGSNECVWPHGALGQERGHGW